VRSGIHSLRRLDQPLVFVEVVEIGFGWRDRKKLDGAGHYFDDSPVHSHLHELAQHREDVVDGLGSPSREMLLDLLDILIGDRIKSF
jgi:hypothetical protein